MMDYRQERIPLITIIARRMGNYTFMAGTEDAVKSQSIDMADEMLKRKDFFAPEHYMFHLKDVGYHDKKISRK